MSRPDQAPTVYPFSAIVGQEAMKTALIVAAVDPSIGGVLIRGQKGTAKSTAVRALASLLSRTQDEKDVCGSRIVPVVELPLNATEDMVTGGLDFGASIRQGRRVFRPGLPARAHGGFLYIDEVNLLADHLVDAILDTCASGRTIVEREGISTTHEARFTLVGTMNPEEGELRPQLLDRFGLCVDVTAETDIDRRMEVLQCREAFDSDPDLFVRQFEEQEKAVRKTIVEATRMLPQVTVERDILTYIVDVCTGARTAGHRADVVIARAARVSAALEGRSGVTRADVRGAARFALPHRARPVEPEDGHRADEQKKGHINGLPPLPEVFDEYPLQQSHQRMWHETTSQSIEVVPARDSRPRDEQPEVVYDIGPTFRVKDIGRRRDRRMRNATGKRTASTTRRKRGKYIGSTPKRLTGDIAFDATLRAAAPQQCRRSSRVGLPIVIHDEDIREKVRESRTGNFLLFVVDASGSMGAKGRMAASKGAVMSLLDDAYRKRDRIAMVSFRKQDAVVNLPPTSSMYQAARLLRELPVGGKTPLAAGLRKAAQILTNTTVKDPECRPVLIVITDGKANESIGKGDPFWEALAVAGGIASDRRVKTVIVDAEEESGFRYGFAARLADVMKGDYFMISDLKAQVLLDIVRKGL